MATTTGKTKLDYAQAYHAAAAELLRVTQLVVMTGETARQEQECSDYLFLMQKREPMVQQLTHLKAMMTEAPEDARQLAEYTRLRQEAESTLRQLVALDATHRQAAQRILAAVKASIREIRQGKTLNTVYAHPSEHMPSGLLDTRQ